MAEVFCCALTSFGCPPAHPSCGELDGLFFGWGLAQRLVYSLNKFRANLSPIPKYSKQIIQSNVLLFQIVNLRQSLASCNQRAFGMPPRIFVLSGRFNCPCVGATHKRPRWSVLRSNDEDPKGITNH